MRLRIVFCMATLVALVATGLGTNGVASAHPSSGWWAAYTCTGGEIGSGTYANIRVTGACSVAADAVIRVRGSLFVAGGAQLDAQSAPSTITVGHDVWAAPGSLVGLGCQPPSFTGNSAHQCTVEPDGHSTITVYGSVLAFDANTVLLNGVTVNGSVWLLGGGGAIPWSIKNNTIGRNVTVFGVTAAWFGLLFNRIGGSATLIKITANDPGDPTPTIYVVRNTVGWNLNCWGLGPNLSGGFIPGEVNTVGHQATGQCASLV